MAATDTEVLSIITDVGHETNTFISECMFFRQRLMIFLLLIPQTLFWSVLLHNSSQWMQQQIYLKHCKTGLGSNHHSLRNVWSVWRQESRVPYTVCLCLFHSACQGRDVWGDRCPSLLQQEQDWGEISNCQMLLLPWTGCWHHPGHALLCWWYVDFYVCCGE